jgi:hypothetical protein
MRGTATLQKDPMTRRLVEAVACVDALQIRHSYNDAGTETAAKELRIQAIEELLDSSSAHAMDLRLEFDFRAG